MPSACSESPMSSQGTGSGAGIQPQAVLAQAGIAWMPEMPVSQLRRVRGISCKACYIHYKLYLSKALLADMLGRPDLDVVGHQRHHIGPGVHCCQRGIAPC